MTLPGWPGAVGRGGAACSLPRAGLVGLLSRGGLRSGGRYASSRKCSSQYRITLYSMSADGLTTNGNAVFCAYFSHISARDNLWGATSPLDPTPRAFGVYTTVLEAQLY